MRTLINDIGMIVRGLAYALTFFGPIVALALYWDRQDKATKARWAQETGRLPIEYQFPRREIIKRWIIGIAVLSASFFIARAAFPGPWLDND